MPIFLWFKTRAYFEYSLTSSMKILHGVGICSKIHMLDAHTFIEAENE